MWTASVARCGFLTYLRRDATALSLLLLSMSITSSFLRMAIDCEPPSSDGSMAYFNSDVNRKNWLLREL